jgi:uncharacterized protein with von Willebrand factor type A (vWA) domain
MSDVPLLLYGVFRRLLERRVPLGVSDYLDALRLLERQVAHGDITEVARRASLRRVCEVLWARSPEEVRLIDRALDEIAPPQPEDVQWLTNLLDDAREAPAVARPSGQRVASTQTTLDPVTVQASGTTTAVAAPSVAVSFESVKGAGGVPLPYPVLPAGAPGTFVLQPQTVIAARALAVLWRRYRRMSRAGARTELDVEATIAEWTRRGVIDRPALRARRVNRARLLILADASPSMAPWRPFLDAVAQSVRLSRLQSAEMFYFANVPRRSLFATADLGGATPADKVYSRFAGASLLVFSDAGAARGFLTRMRVAQTHTFLADANRRMQSVVWVNPMPRDRWDKTTAAALAASSGVTFLPLDQTSMIRAVDVLRGIKAS